MDVDFVIRQASEADAAAISQIYNSYVLRSITTFETNPVEPEDMRKRIQEKLDRYDWVIGELDKKVIGYAYYGPFRPRPAYRHTAESTIYAPIVAMRFPTGIESITGLRSGTAG